MLEGCRHDGELGEWIDLVSSFGWRGRSGVGPLDDDDDGEMLMPIQLVDQQWGGDSSLK